MQNRHRFPRSIVVVAAVVLATGGSSLAAERLAAPPIDALPSVGPFVENRGQWPAAARFVARRGSLAVGVEPDGLLIELERPRSEHELDVTAVRFAFEGAEEATLVGRDQAEGYVNFLLGRDPRGWRTHVPIYAVVSYLGLYPGVELRLRDQDGTIEYDVLLTDDADLDRVVIRCDGAHSMEVAADGALEVVTPLGVLRQSPPTTWVDLATGERRFIECRFRMLDDRRFGFELAEKRPSGLLVIDPGLVWSTLVPGGLGDDIARSIAVDGQGRVTVTGMTRSSFFPTTPGAVITVNPSSAVDAFVTRVNSTGTGLVYSTYLGGTADDEAYDLAVDAAGFTYVVGTTQSADFPVTPFAYDKTFAGGAPTPNDAFIAKLDPTGSFLAWSTYLGGTPGIDIAYAVAVDSAGQVTVAGAAGFGIPTTPGAYDASYNFGGDVFVTRFNAAGSALVWSTVIGTPSLELMFDIALAANGDVIGVGEAQADGFPVTAGAYDVSHGGGYDAFALRLSNDGSSLLWSTYLGGTSIDSAAAVAVATNGEVTVAGTTSSPGFPTTAGVADTSFGGPSEAFVTRLVANGGSLVWSTFLGGTAGTFMSGEDRGNGVALRPDGSAVVVGRTESADLPVTIGCFDDSYNGVHSDGFVATLTATGALAYSSYLGSAGGNNEDECFAVALGADGYANVTGFAGYDDFPTTAGAYGSVSGGGWDVFVTRMDLTSSCPAAEQSYGQGWPGKHGVPALTSSGPPRLCEPHGITIQNSSGSFTAASLFLGTTPVSLLTGYGGTLLVNPIISVPITLPIGSLFISATLPCDPTLCGAILYLQVLEADVAASSGVSFSRGLKLSYGG